MIKVTINTAELILTKGDIVKETTDGIVNAANTRLIGGGGVDGAIHRAGGEGISKECQKIGGCATGKAVITSGGNLKAKYVIHAVAPVYQGGTKGEEQLLRSAYLESLKLASTKNMKSISFPSLGTGAYGYPVREAAHIALQTTVKYLQEHNDINTVRFVLYDDTTYDVFMRELKNVTE